MTALLLLAMIGQCPPGTYCPNPATTVATVTAPATTPAWQWYQLQIDGRTVVVPAYQSGGVIYYDSTRLPPPPESEPESRPKPESKPEPEPKAKPVGDSDSAIGGTLNYGLDMEAIASELSSDRNVIQTNDPQLGALLASNDPGSSEDAARLFRPEVTIQAPDLTRPLIIGFIVVATAILLSRRPRS